MLKNCSDMRTVKITWLLCLSISLHLMGQTDYSKIDNNSKRVPYHLETPGEIAKHLTQNLTTDAEKSRALYIWISHNISYDVDLLESRPKYSSKEAIVKETLENRSGVCQHYSDLFLAMSKAIGLKSYLIAGYTRNSDGTLADVGHAWNAVEIDSSFYLLDITWAAGHVTEGKFYRKFKDAYFLKKPQEFIADHMPFDPAWQFLSNPLRHDDFLERNFDKLNTVGAFDFKDIINNIPALDTIAAIEKSNIRIIHCGTSNPLVKKQIKQNLNLITAIEFSAAVDTLNFGIKNYNLYVDAKNNKFKKPKLTDAEIKAYIDNAESGIQAANEMMIGLSSTDKELSTSLNKEKNRMPQLVKTVALEKEFVNRYINKWKPLRATLFYSYDANKIKFTSKPALF